MMRRWRRGAVVVMALCLAGAALAADIVGTGVIKAVDTRAGALVIAHEAIPALGWPAMTMPFKVTDPKLLAKAPTGRKVQFTLAGGDEPRISALKILE